MLGILLGVLLAVLLAAAPAHGQATVTPTCSIAPVDCSGWFTADVTLTWVVDPASASGAGCGVQSFVADTPGTTVTCSADDGTGPVVGTVLIRLDKTPPDVTAAMSLPPPNSAGWFTAPVSFSFAGSDATSGPAVCDAATYAGPDAQAASVVGTCRDQAGNQSSRAFPLMFDATPPPLSHLAATPGDQRATVRWETTDDAAVIEVRRTPGVGSEPESVVFRGPGSSFHDDRLRNGVRYVYQVRLADAAGNVSVASAAVVSSLPSPDPPAGSGPGRPGPPAPLPRGSGLLLPRPNAKVKASRPPLLRWRPVSRARYYNVQLYRGTRKVLSTWPARPRHQLDSQWSYAGKRRLLSPGRYRWYVWPGYGRRSRSMYGELVGRRSFRVVG